MPVTDAQAEAGKALAETAGKVLDLTKGIGSYLAETIGTIPQDLLGLAGGDWLHEKRQRNLAQMQAKTARILDGIQKERISEPSPSVVMPLLEAARDESREELQEIWAALLAQAMIDGGYKVRRSFFDLVGKLEPIDSLVLMAVSSLPHGGTSNENTCIVADNAYLVDSLSPIGGSTNDLQVSTAMLEELKLITFNRMNGIPVLTAVGRSFLHVLTIPLAPAPSLDTD